MEMRKWGRSVSIVKIIPDFRSFFFCTKDYFFLRGVFNDKSRGLSILNMFLQQIQILTLPILPPDKKACNNANYKSNWIKKDYNKYIYTYMLHINIYYIHILHIYIYTYITYIYKHYIKLLKLKNANSSNYLVYTRKLI